MNLVGEYGAMQAGIGVWHRKETVGASVPPVPAHFRRNRIVRAVLARGFAFLVAIFAAATSAGAHNLAYSVAHLSIERDGHYRLEIYCHTTALIMGLPQGFLNDAQAEQFLSMKDERLARLVARTGAELAQTVSIGINGRPIETPAPDFPSPASLRHDASFDSFNAQPSEPIVFRGRLDAFARTIDVAIPGVFGNTLLTFRGVDGRTLTRTLSPDVLSDSFEVAGVLPGFAAAMADTLRMIGQFVWLGVTHIFPWGLDHMLFVISLAIFSWSIRPLLLQISAFTLAHSLTLCLAAFGVVYAPAALVEPLIAASIAVVAIANIVWKQLVQFRSAAVFGFGLLHGLGFASALGDAGLPPGGEALALLGFNAGIEIGQLLVVAAAFAVVGWARDHALYRQRVVYPVSLTVAAIAVVWTVERTLTSLST